ncbi:MAG: hypothetical protein QM784_19880 [Polyangiaceae bacterium]
MKELLAPHWLIGAGLSLGGAVAYRYGSSICSGRALVVMQLMGLFGIAAGLFVVARGTSRAAKRRRDEDDESSDANDSDEKR